jgi:hypothetical protein
METSRALYDREQEDFGSTEVVLNIVFVHTPYGPYGQPIANS